MRYNHWFGGPLIQYWWLYEKRGRPEDMDTHRDACAPYVNLVMPCVTSGLCQQEGHCQTFSSNVEQTMS